MTKKIWFNIFIRVAVIFICTLLIIIVANSTLLYRYYLSAEKRIIKEQADLLCSTDLSNTVALRQTLSDINENYSIDVEIYADNNTVLYTTQGDKLMEFIHQGKNDKFSMSRRPLEPIGNGEIYGGYLIQTAKDRVSGEEFLTCGLSLDDSISAELKIRISMLENSADIAGKFVTAVTAVCFFISIVWIFFFARKFSRPITEMTAITHRLSHLDFSKRVPIAQNNEIGVLGASINNMSLSLQNSIEELRQANLKLQGEVENERRLDKMRKQFVANVSHELKTPISIISGYAEGLKLNVNSEKKTEYCNIILDESARMNTLVLSLLELSRYESGQVELKKEVFKIKDITDNLVKRIFADGTHSIIDEIDCDHCIFADAVQFEQVIKSYLENAKSHTENQGEIILKSEEKDELIRISVFNEGKHIDEEIMPLIWQSFYRGEQSHKREGGRFGLGLSIVAAIASLHGTPCGVYNTENGVCFWIEFNKK